MTFGTTLVLVFWNVTPCSLVETYSPWKIVKFLLSHALPRPRRQHLQQHFLTLIHAFSWDRRPTLSMHQTALTDQRHSKPPQLPHFPPPNSPTPFILQRVTSRDVHFSLSYRCFINSFKRIRLLLFSKNIPTVWLSTNFLTLFLHVHKTKLLSNVFT